MFVLAACSIAEEPTSPLTPITIQLKFTHQAQFAGFYAAAQKGFYTDEGLAVTFLEGGPAIDPTASVLADEAQFGIAAADNLILKRADGHAVRALATIYQHNPLVFASLAQFNIRRPQDFAGKRIRVVQQQTPILDAVLARVGLSPDAYTPVVLPSDLALFASGETPIWSLYLTGLTIAAQEAGYDLNVVFPDDYGVHFYGDTVFATDEFIVQHPDLVLRFLRATFKGWNYALGNAEEVGRMVTDYWPDADPDLEALKITKINPLVRTGEAEIGWMKAESWANMMHVLRQQGVLEKSVDIAQIYTLEFLQDIYTQ